VCVGKQFAEAEGFVFLNLFLRTFKITAVHDEGGVTSGVSAKPADGLEVLIELRPQT
jgi:cytochrome P450